MTARDAEQAAPNAVGESPSRASILGLDGLNFFLADVQSGVGPFMVIYLKGEGWNQQQVGIALMLSGIAGILAQTPAGGLVDHSRSKRALIAVGIAMLAASQLSIALLPRFWPVLAAQLAIGFGASVFVPAVSAISLGLMGQRRFDVRQGRNQTANSAGNVFAALSMAVVAHYLSNRAIFFFSMGLAIPALIALTAIKPDEINYERARGAAPSPGRARAGTTPRASRLLKRRRHVLGIFMACAVLFHLANASMLSLLGEMLAEGQGNNAVAIMSGCVITTQVIIALSAAWVGKLACQKGRRPLLLIAFAVLPIRGMLYTLTGNPWVLASFQILDGIAASIFGVVAVLVIADLAKGTGRFNLTLGIFTTAIGIGAALSQFLGGSIALHFGYRVGFLFLAGIAALALSLFYFFMPETIADGDE